MNGWKISIVCGLCCLGFATLIHAAPTTTPASAPATVQTVNADEFERLSKLPEHPVLDVRTPAEFAAGHLPGAINLDWKAKDFAEKVAALDKSKTYMVHCAVGGRSRSACEKMIKLSFPNVYNLEGGIMAWQRAGKKVEKEDGK